MTVGDKGVAIIWETGGFNLTGGTVTLYLAPGREPNAIGPALTLTPVVVQPGGLTAAYITTGTEATQGGFWQAWFKVVSSDGDEVLISPPGTIYINPPPTIAV